MPVQIRISNHGTYLKTWVDRQYLSESKERLLDPSHCINISVVFIDEGQNITKDCPNQPNCENCLIETCIPQTFEGQNELGHAFKVLQYCYQSKFIKKRYINGIVKAIAESFLKGEYIDPLRNLYRQSKSKTLRSDTQITKESKINKNMKNVKQINESQLRAIVAESVKRVLKEESEQESIYQTICNLESDLKTVIANTDNSSSQAFGSSEEKLKMIANQLSHIDGNMANQASSTFKKLIEVISELQNLRINLKTYGSEDSYWGHNFKTPNGTVGLSNYR